MKKDYGSISNLAKKTDAAGSFGAIDKYKIPEISFKRSSYEGLTNSAANSQPNVLDRSGTEDKLQILENKIKRYKMENNNFKQEVKLNPGATSSPSVPHLELSSGKSRL
jgi:hypothetical protein